MQTFINFAWTCRYLPFLFYFFFVHTKFFSFLFCIRWFFFFTPVVWRLLMAKKTERKLQAGFPLVCASHWAAAFFYRCRAKFSSLHYTSFPLRYAALHIKKYFSYHSINTLYLPSYNQFEMHLSCSLFSFVRGMLSPSLCKIMSQPFFFPDMIFTMHCQRRISTCHVPFASVKITMQRKSERELQWTSPKNLWRASTRHGEDNSHVKLIIIMYFESICYLGQPFFFFFFFLRDFIFKKKCLKPKLYAGNHHSHRPHGTQDSNYWK